MPNTNSNSFSTVRKGEQKVFSDVLEHFQSGQNLIITGERGIGKTTLLESFGNIARDNNWVFLSSDCNESTSASEDSIVVRLLTDISLVTSGVAISQSLKTGIGFYPKIENETVFLKYSSLIQIYHDTPGLALDKLKNVFEVVWDCLKETKINGIVFTYDEAHNLSNHLKQSQYPLSLLLDIFKYIQKRNIPFLLVLSGLPSLLINILEARDYTEKAFKVLNLENLNFEQTKQVVLKSLLPKQQNLLKTKHFEQIFKLSGGHPYLIQFLSQEFVSVLSNQNLLGHVIGNIDLKPILDRLDAEFFDPKLDSLTEKEKVFLGVLADLSKDFFNANDVLEFQKNEKKAFGRSQIYYMFGQFFKKGLLSKNKRGSYVFAVPMFADFIKRSKN